MVEGRLFSFTHTAVDTIDLSTGALPASPVTREVLREGVEDELAPYLDTDGYFPAGLPVLRQAIADHLSRTGIPTQAQQVLVTSGSQQATFLTMRSLVGQGDLALTEDPSYRGGLEALRTVGARIEGIRTTRDGLDLDLLAGRWPASRPALLPDRHPQPDRPDDAEPGARSTWPTLINRRGIATVEDCCSFDLTLNGPPATGRWRDSWTPTC